MKNEVKILGALRRYYSEVEIPLGMAASSEGIKKADLLLYMMAKKLPFVYCAEDSIDGLKRVDRSFAREAYAKTNEGRVERKTERCPKDAVCDK